MLARGLLDQPESEPIVGQSESTLTEPSLNLPAPTLAAGTTVQKA